MRLVGPRPGDRVDVSLHGDIRSVEVGLKLQGALELSLSHELRTAERGGVAHEMDAAHVLEAECGPNWVPGLRMA